MVRKEKLLEKARNNPDGMSFQDFVTLMGRYGWIEDRQRGSHKIWYSPEKHRLCVQDRNGKAKGYQVKQFLVQFDKEQNDG